MAAPLSPEQISFAFEATRTIAELAVIPLLAVLWKLNGAINHLEKVMYQKFLTVEAHEAWHRNEQEAVSRALQTARLNDHRQNVLDL